MSQIKYHYALEGNKLVPIEEVNKNERQYHTFKCVGCDSEMIPKQGQKNAWHFAHKSNDENCCNETYLHKLAKRLIKERFESKRPFVIRYKRRRLFKCSEFEKCLFYDRSNCLVSKESENLKELYDVCQEEAPIDGFKADILLSSSKQDREPVLIEIQVTHECSEEKLKSGLKIIEITVNCEEDIKNLIKEELIKESLNDYLSFEQAVKPTIRLHNFDDGLEDLGQRIISRFVLYSNGQHQTIYNKSCHNHKKKLDPRSIFEVSILMNSTDRYASVIGDVIALQYYPDYKTCNLCRNKCESSLNNNKNRHSKQKNAINCNYFVLDEQMVSKINQTLPQHIIIEKKKHKFVHQLDLQLGFQFD